MPEDLSYGYFVRVVQRLIGVDLESYRQGQLRRRLDSLLQRVGVSSFAEYGKLLERDPVRLQEFRDFFTINVTEFFRDAERFRHLQTWVLPRLLECSSSLRVWSAACSIGAEPYSVAILLKELAPRGRHRILATDVDRTILERARRGDGYGRLELRGVPPATLTRYFKPTGDGATYAVSPEVRAMVEFREHNLLSDAPATGFDLVLCRNVVIYFTQDAKVILYERLVNALRPDGILFVGGTEIIGDCGSLGLRSTAPSFYQRAAEPAVQMPPRQATRASA